MRIIILAILLNSILIAQYDSTMVDLIKTTYQRSFDKTIINSYLNSDKDKKVSAALLSISQSDDTSFVPDLLKLDLFKFGSEICFALGQVGKCEESIKFLRKYLISNPPADQYPNIFFAIGKIGNTEDLNNLINFYSSSDKNVFPCTGISEAILQFNLRGIKSDSTKSILIREIQTTTNEYKRRSDALFTLARYGSSNKILDDLNNILQMSDSTLSQNYEEAAELELKNISLKQFALMNLQRLKYFPSDIKILKKLFDCDNDLILIELAKSIIYFDFNLKNTNLLPTVFKILDNPNLNFAIQGAISIRDIDTSYIIKKKSYIRKKILETLSDVKKNEKLKSEVFLTGYKILGDYQEFSRILNWFKANDILKIKFAALNPDTLQAIKKLIQFYGSKKITNKIEALTQILNFSSNKHFNNEITHIIFNSLSSSYPPLISLAADGINIEFIKLNSSKLKEIVSEQILTYKDNPDFIESMISLINLSGKIDTLFFNQIIRKANSTKLYSFRNFISSKTKTTAKGLKELDEFDNIWNYAFKYSGAIIKTNKGVIKLKFNSDLTPITVTNFCRLASNKFYEGIIFHRVVPGFVIQAGDPTQTGWGGPGYDIVSEFSDTNFGIGQVGMASAGKDTEGSQFFIMQGCYPHLNHRYSLFAKVVDGLDVVYNIIEGDEIQYIELIQ